MKTTPPGGADGTYQYKVVTIPPEEIPKILAGAFGNTMSLFGGNDPEILKQASEARQTVISLYEKLINNTAKDGWEYVGTMGSDATFLLFRKK
ncbi:MAG: hypothetical protein V1905_03540 [bacterium]